MPSVPARPYRLAVLSSHPVQYMAPLFRKLADHPEVDLMVYFLSDHSIRGSYDSGFNTHVKWDIPLLDGYPYKFLRPVGGTNGASNWALHPAIVTELRRHRYTALLFHGYTAVANWLAMLGAWMSGTPLMFRGETDLLLARSSWKQRVKRLVLTALFRRIQAFLYSYTANAEYFRHYGVPESKLFFCPCAVDNAFWQDRKHRLNGAEWGLRETLGIPAAVPVILFAAKLMPLKRAFDLLEAYRGLAVSCEAWLVFVGDGEQRLALERFVKEHDLKRVRFVGFKNQSELPGYYAMSDIFVLCSTHDNSPKALNEAMNFGLPAIVTDGVGTAPDLIRHGHNGYIYPVGSVHALRAALEGLLENPARIREMGKRSVEIVSEWTFDRDVEGIVNALRSISRSNLPEASHAG